MNHLKKKDSKKLNPFFSMTQRIEPSFWTCFNELNLRLVWLTELNFFFLSRNMTQRIETFLNQRIELFFFSNNTTQRTEPFFNMTQRIEYDSKDWTFFLFQFDRKFFIFFNMSQRIEPIKKKRLKELNPLFEHVSMNWTFV